MTSDLPIAARPHLRAIDAVCALLLFTATVGFLMLLSRHLDGNDESYFLYEAKRIRDGEVMYRDIFQFVTPLASYCMAVVFWLFGTTLTAARTAMAVVHGATAVVLYAAARRLAVRRTLAVVVPLAYLAICYPIFGYASWHWFATLGTLVLLLSLIVAPWAENPPAAGLPGVVTGIVICIQQQKGLVLAAGIAALLVLDAVIDGHPDLRSLARRVGWFVGGAAVVVVPVLAIFATLAGPGILYGALVRFPLENYRTHIGCQWGALPPLGGDAGYSFPLLLRYSPVALVLPALECGIGAVRGHNRQRVRALGVLVVVSTSSALSIRYYPDVVHIAFIAPAFWLCGAVALEWMCSLAQPRIIGRVAGAFVASALGAVLVVNLVSYLQLMRSMFPVVRDTAFGPMHFSAPWEPNFIDAVRARLADAGSPDLFSYGISSPYLTTGGRNPTPYQFFNPAVSPPSHTARTLATLRSRRVQYIVTAPLITGRRDPITRLMETEYERVDLPSIPAFSTYLLYRRKDAVPVAANADS